MAIKGRDLAGYWSSGGDTPGQWLGAQAQAMGLAGQQVTQEAADAIYKDGVDPTTGKALGRRWPQYATAEQRYEALVAAEPNATEARQEELKKRAETAGNQTARAYWEQVYSPVKSWSILWGVSSDEVRSQLEEVEEAAFQKVFNRVEDELCWTRVGPGGGAQVKARGFIASSFVHRTSRAGDPDFHRHVAISAKVQAEDGRWLALDGRPLMRMTVALSEMYTTELERGMYQRFGIAATPREDTIRQDKRPVREFLGVGVGMVKLFSQRRQQTEKALKQLTKTFIEREGRKPSRAESYALAQAAALAGRPDKRAKSIGAERRTWRRQAWQAGFKRPARAVRQAQKASREALEERPDLIPLRDVASRVLDTLEGERESWTRSNVEAESLRQLTASGWHLQGGEEFDDLVSRLTDHVLNPSRCELISPPETVAAPKQFRRADGSSAFVQVGAERYTSHRTKRWEHELRDSSVRPATTPLVDPDDVDAALARGDAERGFAPSDEQRQVVHAIFSGDTRTTAIIGRAGTGKTTIMRLVKEVADQHGIEILGLAGGQMQADNLGQTAGIRAENIARWRVMSTTYGVGDERWTLKPNTLVIVDEAGQASTPDLHELLQQVTDVDGRLLPVGDPKQLGSPGVGGALAEIESAGGAVYLSEVRRFRSVGGQLRHWEIDAATAVANGDAETSWQAYDERGRIQEGSLDEMLHAAYGAWQRDTSDGLSSILIAPTNALAAQLSTWARDDRVAAGIVDNRRTVTLSSGNVAGAGDQIVTRVNRRDLQCDDTRQFVRNGDVWTVEQVDRDGALRAVHSLTGTHVWLPPEYAASAVELGYAITKDRAQGVDVQTGHGVLVEEMNANAVYPEMTRGGLANYAYVATEAQVDPETGEPAAPKTGRQVWSSIVSRDGTQLSATARQRQLWDEAEAIRTHVPTLRYALEDIADSEAQDAIVDLLPHVGEAIVTAPAWPALRSQLLQFAGEGVDTDALVTAADSMRAWDGDIEDYAAILHGRNRKLLDEQPDAFQQDTETDQQPATAPTFETDPEPVGDDVLAALGLRLPQENGFNGGDERHAFVYGISSAIQNRATHLADTAKAEAAAGQGWATAYGDEPDDVADAVAWHDRIQAAAAFRDLANYTGADPTGPAPTADDPLQRGLWRAAQTLPDEHETAARADDAAASGAPWMDAVGTPPSTHDPVRATWAEAAIAVENYRRLWEYGNESAAIGDRPAEPVQAADYDHAAEALAAYRFVRAHPNLVEADPETLSRLIARGDAGARAADEAAAALASYHRADLALTAAAQAAEDAANRAQAARAARENGSEPGPMARDTDRLAELDQDASRAELEALRAQRIHDDARTRVEASAPGAVQAREDARRAEQAQRVVARRALQREEEPDAPPEPDSGQQVRPHIDLNDSELISIAARSVETAAQLDEERRATADHLGNAVPEDLRQHAAELREESRHRALMEPEQRIREADERAARRETSAKQRLERAYAGPHQTEDRKDASRRRQHAPHSHAEPPGQTTKRRSVDPGRAPRSAVEARLTHAHADRTGPESLHKAKGAHSPSTAPEGRKRTSNQRPQTPQREQTPPTPKKTSPRRPDDRLDAARAEHDDPRTGRTPPNRRRRPPPPNRPGPGI